MQDQNEIAEVIRRALQDKDDLVAVYLFGSVAAGRAHTLSDVDVAVLFRDGIAEESTFGRVLEIGTALESALSGLVDVVALNQAGPALCFQVLRNGRLVIERDRDARSLFVMRALGRYYDARPYLDYQNAQLVARLRREGLGRGYHGDRDALSEARRLSAKLAANARRPAG
jgi:predicted nucleotidyltransferase